MTKWVKVSERLPGEEFVLIYVKSMKQIFVAELSGNGWMKEWRLPESEDNDGHWGTTSLPFNEITHWQELPEAPKDE